MNNKTKELANKIESTKNWKIDNISSGKNGSRQLVYFRAYNPSSESKAKFVASYSKRDENFEISRATWTCDNVNENFQLITATKTGSTLRTVTNFVNRNIKN